MAIEVSGIEQLVPVSLQGLADECGVSWGDARAVLTVADLFPARIGRTFVATPSDVERMRSALAAFSSKLARPGHSRATPES